jgi:hypothetical protein
MSRFPTRLCRVRVSSNTGTIPWHALAVAVHVASRWTESLIEDAKDDRR